MRLIDLTGKKFNYLTVIKRDGTHTFPSGQSKPLWLCRCDCGKLVHELGQNLTKNKIKSCGCRQLDARTKHNYWGTKAYRTWDHVRQRCYNPKATGYQYWGGRGIKMYEPWINDPVAFCDYVSKLPHFGEEGRTLDRINNDGNYEPNNLRWATRSEQNANKRYTKGKRLSEEHKLKISESLRQNYGDK